MSEIVIKISDCGKITVENNYGGVKSFKQIAPDALLQCINISLLRGGVSSGLLPRNCLSFASYDNGDREICLLHTEEKANISYFGTEYKDFPLPRLVFGFKVSAEGCVSNCRIGVIAEDKILKPETVMYHYPLSNVSGFHICLGNNKLPKCSSLHTLASLPYFIMEMPNNLDRFSVSNNKKGLEMRALLELLKDKEPSFYYSDILVPNGAVFDDFINGRSI